MSEKCTHDKCTLPTIPQGPGRPKAGLGLVMIMMMIMIMIIMMMVAHPAFIDTLLSQLRGKLCISSLGEIVHLHVLEKIEEIFLRIFFYFDLPSE